MGSDLETTGGTGRKVQVEMWNATKTSNARAAREHQSCICPCFLVENRERERRARDTRDGFTWNYVYNVDIDTRDLLISRIYPERTNGTNNSDASRKLSVFV